MKGKEFVIMPENNYYTQRDILNLEKIGEIKKQMPVWFSAFLRSIETTTSTTTRLNYCYDTRLFFNYLIDNDPRFGGIKITLIPAEMLGELSLTDLEIYVEYLGYYVKDDETIVMNAEKGKARKIASLKTLYKYLQKKKMIQANPSMLLSMPKIHDKPIIRLDESEIADFLHIIETGEGLSERQKKLHFRFKKRDMAIAVLFLTTGIRVSELVGLDIKSFNFNSRSFAVTRKGGNATVLYFNEEAERVLLDYLEERKIQQTDDKDMPMFLSAQQKRLNVKSVENIIQKYAKVVTPNKHITPHKLRSTYGTMLYDETGDIYLVADVLGHKDINTTQKHYAAQSERNRKAAASVIRLQTKTNNN